MLNNKTISVFILSILTASALRAQTPDMHLDAALGITQSSGSVSNWDDQQGGNNDASQSTAGYQPSLISNGINGLTALSFDGIDDYLDVSNHNVINTGGPYSSKTLMVVFQTSDDISSRQLIWEQGGGTRGLNFYLDNGKLYINGWNLSETQWGPTALNTSIEANTTYIATMIMDSNAGTFSGFVNGQSIGSVTGIADLHNHSGSNALGHISNNTYFHDGQKTGNNYYKGLLAEFFVYNQVLTTIERENLESQLQDKYVPVQVVSTSTPDMHLDAALGITQSSGSVSTWGDQQGGNNNASQSTSGYQPILINDGINGLPVLSFDGANDHLEVADHSNINTGGPYDGKTLTVVFKTSEDINSRQIIWEQGGSTRGLSFYIDNGKIYINGWNRAETQWGPTAINAEINTNTTYVATMIMNSNAGTFNGYVNGQSIGSVTGIADLHNHGDNCALGGLEGSTYFHDGSTNGTVYFKGQMAEFYSFDQALSNTDRTSLENDLNSKYAESTPALASFYLEPECNSALGSRWVIKNDDANASNKEYLTLSDGNRYTGAVPAESNAQMSLPFSVSEDDNYAIWARVIIGGGTSDSYWIKVDDGSWVKWNGIATGNSWHWDQVHDWDNNKQVVTFNLTAGNHTLYMAVRENGPKLDKIFITNTSDAPQDGEAAINCGSLPEEPIAPPLPTSFKLTALSTNQVKLDWQDNSDNETGFEIWRSVEPEANYSLVHTTAANVISYTDEGLEENTRYYYKIRAVGNNNSEYTTAMNVITLTSAPDGLVGQWKLDNNPNDATDNNIDGTALNGPQYSTDAKEGSHSLYLDGTNQKIDYGNPAQLPSGTSSRTMSAWLKTDALDENYRFAISYGKGSLSKAMFIGRRGSKLYGGGYGSNHDLIIDNFWQANQWYHFVLTYDGTTASLYADGQLVTSANRNWNLELSKFYIGNQVNDKSEFWQGHIDDVRIYNKALSADEVQNLYQSYTSSPETEPTAPALPTSFRLTSNSSSQIQLDWEDNSNDETGFEIWRSAEPDANYSLVHTTAANAVSYTDNGLTSGTQYFYKIRATGENNSEYTLVRSTITHAIADPVNIAFKPQYNGNISAIKWGNSSDGVNTQQKLYEYEYDPMNRLKFADYVEKDNNTGSWNQKVGGFNVEGLDYDLNGNIKHLKRYAHHNQLRILDDMTYAYENNNRSNRLQSVTEAGGADVKEGFVDGNLTDTDYIYDANGNLEVDHNKGIISIEYNHLNLPYIIDFGTKGKIRYIYDAAGIKLRKDVLDVNGNVVDKTFYINGIQYKQEATQANATLDFIQTEEGRAVPAENSSYAYEYFIKDHLGNVRASLKTEPEVIEFLATMEQDSVDEKLYFKNLESRQLDAANAKNGTYSAYLNNASEFASNRAIGPAIMLRVSPGDTINASVYGKYADKTDNTEHVVDNIFTLLATAFGLNAATSEAGLTANGMETALVGQGAITPDGTAPKTYLNYIFLHKNFDPNNNHTGFERLPAGALNNYQLLEKEIPIKKEGYLYIFVANESPFDQGVWFDDFKVEVTKSPVTAVSDYYPFGMLQAGNSTSSGDPLGNKYLYNGKELQEDLGLQWYDYGARMYQADLGRWFAVDPLADVDQSISISPFHYVANNPILNIDPDGLDWYANQETGALEYFEDENEGLEGYTWVAQNDASYDNLINAYSFINDQAASSLLDEVVVEPSISEHLEDFGNSTLELSSDMARDFVNSFTFVGSGITMPIINAVGGSDVSWAKVYTFDENWSLTGQELDNGTLSDEATKQAVHSTMGVLTTIIPAAPLVKTAKPLVNKTGDFIANTAIKTTYKKVIDHSIGYEQK